MGKVVVSGLNETLREIAKMDKELMKQIRKDWREIAKPAVEDARKEMPDETPLSGMAKGRTAWVTRQPDKKIKAYISTKKPRRKAGNVTDYPLATVEERDAAGIIFDMAGRKSKGGSKSRRRLPNGNTVTLEYPQTLIANLEAKAAERNYKKEASRAMYPGVEKSAPALARQIDQSLNKRIREYNRKALR